MKAKRFLEHLAAQTEDEQLRIVDSLLRLADEGRQSREKLREANAQCEDYKERLERVRDLLPAYRDKMADLDAENTALREQAGEDVLREKQMLERRLEAAIRAKRDAEEELAACKAQLGELKKLKRDNTRFREAEVRWNEERTRLLDELEQLRSGRASSQAKTTTVYPD